MTCSDGINMDHLVRRRCGSGPRRFISTILGAKFTSSVRLRVPKTIPPDVGRPSACGC